jgi:hypothetical protein
MDQASLSHKPRIQSTTNEIKRIQQIVGTLLYYAHAIDSTMLVLALGTIASEQSKGTEQNTEQSKGTEQTADALVHLLSYCATLPEAIIRYHVASDMILQIDSNALYLSMPQARSSAGGHYYFSSQSTHPNKPPLHTPLNNGTIHTVCAKLKPVMASTAEAKVGALFVNGQEATVIRTTLAELGHPQPATLIKTDNSTAAGISKNSIKQRRSHIVDMHFYWVQDRVSQGQFLVYWKSGTDNVGDYYKKQHSPAHHQQIQPHYLHTRHSNRNQHLTFQTHPLRGCANSHTKHRPLHNNH